MYSVAMSTRSQIRFVTPDGNQVAQVYKHSDGYPENIIPLLGELRDVLQNEGWVRGPEYAAAQFIFMDKLRALGSLARKLAGAVAEHDPETERDYGLYAELQEQDGIGPARAEAATAMAEVLTDPSMWHGQGSMYCLGGHGVEAGNIHGDEEYIYEVTVPMHGPEEWSVKVSGDFPSPQWETRSGEKRGFDYPEGETAWDRANWMYTGSLEHAESVIQAAEEEYEANYADDGDVYHGDYVRQSLETAGKVNEQKA